LLLLCYAITTPSTPLCPCAMQSTSRQTTDIIGLSMAHCGGEERAEFAKLTVYMVPKLLIPKLLVHKQSCHKTLFSSVTLDTLRIRSRDPH
jgi:hypothetical protein